MNNSIYYPTSSLGNNMLSYAVNILVLLLLSSDFLYRYCSLFGLSTISSILVWSKLILSIYILFENDRCQRRYRNRTFIFIYITYSLYCFYYIYIDARIPLEEMSGLQSTNFILLLQFAIVTLPLLSVDKIVRYFDGILFAKTVAIITSILFVLYFSEVSPLTYFAYSDSEITSEELEELSVIHPFHIAHYAGQALLMLLFIKARFTKYKLLNYIIFISAFLINISGLIIASKRGPILFFVISIIYIYYIKMIINRKVMFSIMFLIVIFFLFGDSILEQLNKYLPSITQRFANTIDDGGSRRFGDKDSTFYVALMQILENPYFGSHLRILNKGWLYGCYPHNFFLETLMCTGVFYSLFFYKYLFSVIKYANKIVLTESIYNPLIYCFYFTFLMLMTSESICFNISFWLPLSILSFLQINKITK